jgi:nicotinate dehydrogenase subunit A
MKMIELHVNGESRRVDADESTPLLAVLRESLNLTGSRFGCGQGECGACMVWVDGRPETSCNLPVGSVGGAEIRTIEGLGSPEAPHALQQAFIDERAGQCGYCLSGIMISAAALLRENPEPSRDQIIAALEPHLCRCGAQSRMIRAIRRAASSLRESRS